MAATRQEIAHWFDMGVQRGHTHMIVMCDTYDWEDYPVYLTLNQNAREVATQYDGHNMQRVMEVYNLRMDRDAQLAEPRAFNY